MAQRRLAYEAGSVFVDFGIRMVRDLCVCQRLDWAGWSYNFRNCCRSWYAWVWLLFYVEKEGSGRSSCCYGDGYDNSYNLCREAVLRIFYTGNGFGNYGFSYSFGCGDVGHEGIKELGCSEFGCRFFCPCALRRY